MKFLYGLYGASIPVIRDFAINPKEKFEAGEVVTMSTDGIIGKNAVGPAVGVAAEDHSGEKDILNARSDGNKLRIDITGGGVYALAAPKVKATGGNGTTLICSSENIVSVPSGVKLVLVQKGENSENTDSVGTERAVTNTSFSDGTATFTVSDGGVISDGDVYAIIPAYGYKGNVAEDSKSFTFNAGKGIDLTVLGYDKKTMQLEVLLGSKFYE